MTSLAPVYLPADCAPPAFDDGPPSTPPGVSTLVDPLPPDDGPPSIPPDDPPPGITVQHTDIANAEALLRLHPDDLRHAGLWHKWLSWEGDRWLMSDGARALRYAVETTRVMADDAAAAIHAIIDTITRKGATQEALDMKNKLDTDFAWAAKSQDRRRIEAMLAVAASFPSFALDPADLDADPWLLNVANGTIDLRTSRRRPHLRTDLITKLAPVDYDPEATCPTWTAFLDRCMAGDASMLAYLQRLVGYSLTGVINEHVLAFHFGSGANGKTTFLSTLQRMLGDYAVPAHPRLIFRSQSGGDRHLTERATLYRRRLVTCSEVSEAVAFDEPTIKDLTGGDLICARRMREDEWAFAPTHKLHVCGNEKPVVRATDDGFWRRLHLVPWTVTIPTSERDHTLPDRLVGELPGILAWAVRGCAEWQRVGLAPPPQVLAASAEYRATSDALGQFLAARCTLEPEARCSRRALRSAYEEWCHDEGHEPIGARRLGAGLRRHNVESTTVRDASGHVDGWRGIALRDVAVEWSDSAN